MYAYSVYKCLANGMLVVLVPWQQCTLTYTQFLSRGVMMCDYRVRMSRPVSGYANTTEDTRLMLCACLFVGILCTCSTNWDGCRGRQGRTQYTECPSCSTSPHSCASTSSTARTSARMVSAAKNCAWIIHFSGVNEVTFCCVVEVVFP